MKEAQRLITLTCPTDLGGQHYARELVKDQTLENLAKFSDHLHRAHKVLVKSGQCECKQL